MIVRAYRKYIPQKYRNLIYNTILGDVLLFFRNFKITVGAKLVYRLCGLIPKTTINNAFAFMRVRC